MPYTKETESLEVCGAIGKLRKLKKFIKCRKIYNVGFLLGKFRKQ